MKLPWMKSPSPSRAPSQEWRAAVPEGVRIYAIGDVHGRDDLLSELQTMIYHDASVVPYDRNVIIYLGDYIDRGLGVVKVIQNLMTPPPVSFESHFLIGNHEAVLLQFLQDSRIGRDWMKFGGEATLHAYGVPAPESSAPVEAFSAAQHELRARLPADHLQFFRELRLTVAFGDYVFVHAGLRPGVPFPDQNPDDMIWIRDDFLDSDEDFGFVVVHGHTPRSAVIRRHNRIGVDTGAYYSDCLSALVLEGNNVRVLAT